jgi:hypothetical protein
MATDTDRRATREADAFVLGRSRDEEERPIEAPGVLGHLRTALIAMLIFTRSRWALSRRSS